MRIAGLIGVAAVAAACSHSVGGDAEPSASVTPTPPGTTTTTTTAAAPSTPRPAAAAPGKSASLDEVIRWIEAGTPADPGTYHVAFRDGVSTRLGDDIAFTAPSGPPNSNTSCITDAALDNGALTCLLDLTSPPPRPPDGEGVWKPGWIEFPGASLLVGALRGDPGPFVKGNGPDLAPGQSLMFGDDRCRSDAAGLFCVNYAHRSAMWISAEGIVPFGCLQPAAPPPGNGAMFSC
ncbi:hypothetical protein Mycch_3040 [Mycolicibacterium chubuense NBB4]|uniref:Lipoprotein LppI n=1 Tax=Mycolicibacterium chubuense (strain NBB4) TaxID=710421 RepID=I4BKI5_MYCCN|nr:hypothetical protein [Mycolicibacterium chubuense]AFM17792.1 hypothetical protein Mycch_3040 [Mycolicibacterium chubuense NBB4]